MKVWLVSREYADIAEAGGVKNVACSLSENLVKLGHKVILFIPLYGCTNLKNVSDFSCVWRKPVELDIIGRKIVVSFAHGTRNGVDIVFVCNRAFLEKLAVYTYTREEEQADPSHRQGQGHCDALYLNTLFQKTVVAYGETCKASENPDIIHCQDATGALVPSFLQQKIQEDSLSKKFYSRTRCVVTIHNAGPGYHHEYPDCDEARRLTGLPDDVLLQAVNGYAVEPFLLAAQTACLTTVSEHYATEILEGKTETAGLSDCFRKNYVPVLGITNGIDVQRYDPSDTKISLLPFAYNPLDNDLDGKFKCRESFLNEYASLKCAQADENKVNASVEQYGYLKNDDGCVYIAFHGRLVQQKGISVLARAADIILSRFENVKFIFMGQGQPELEMQFLQVALKYEGNCVFFRGYDRLLARLCIAVADFAVFPSFFEPCGLEDFIAQIFGTIPVAHATGGLCKILDEETGFLYDKNTPEVLAEELHSLISIFSATNGSIFRRMISYTANYVSKNYSWENVAQEYVSLYESLRK